MLMIPRKGEAQRRLVRWCTVAPPTAAPHLRSLTCLRKGSCPGSSSLLTAAPVATTMNMEPKDIKIFTPHGKLVNG